MNQSYDHDAADFTRSLVGFATGISPKDLAGSTRGMANIARARQIAMYMAHVGLGMSYSRVSSTFLRDKSTVSHACQLVEDWRDDERLDDWLADLEDMLERAKIVRQLDLPLLSVTKSAVLPRPIRPI